MQLPDEPETPPQINIVPMIDVVFAVLAFFMLSSLFLTRSEGLPVALPTAQTAQVQANPQVVVTLDASGVLQVGEATVDQGQLVAAVQALMLPGEASLVVIRADASVPHGQVVAVMDQLRTLPGVQLAIATEDAN